MFQNWRAPRSPLLAISLSAALAVSCGGEVASGRGGDAAPPDARIAPSEPDIHIPPVVTVDASGVWPCAPSRWGLCPVVGYLQCSPLGDGWVLPEPCACDVFGPLGPEDCKLGESFVCLKATAAADGVNGMSVTPFACVCIPTRLDCSACENLQSKPKNLACDIEARPDGVNSIWCGCPTL